MEWVTDLRNKYSSDIFFRTEFNVISLQITFAVVISILVAVSFNYIYKDILQTIIEGISENIKNNGTFTSSDIVDSIQLVRAKNFFTFFAFAVSITLIFGYIIAKMTLSPTRSALQSQKRFVSDIAHELRTPLSVIKTNSEVALLDDTHNDRIRKIFKNNIEELDRVSAIINNLLTFSNLVHPEKIKFGAVNMGDVIDTSIKKLDELVRRKQIKLNVRKVSPNAVLGNVTALEQITINLIKNAITYNREGGSVDISVEPDYKGNIVLEVRDNGIGISQDDLIHIFEPFYRAERSRNRQSGSTGLGLTIVSELVKLHYGKISVSSYEKKGTTVTVSLPYNKIDPGESMGGVDEEEQSGNVSLNFFKNRRRR